LLHDEVVAEAADNISRLLPHPSLTLWCGNNECLQGWTDWGWPLIVGDRSWGDGFYRHLLPEIVGRLDPTRPYIDGSPSSLASGSNPNDPHAGTVHLWDVWNERDYEHYRSHHPRFVAEFGFQAPPTLATITSAVSTRPLDVDTPELQHHQKAIDGEAKLQRALFHHFGEVADFDDWLYLTNVNQARAIEVGVGHFRAQHERCSGVVWWQLDDCWPAISWSVIDRAGRRKPSWYALRRSFADRLLVLDPGSDGQLDLVLVNDTAVAWNTAAEVRQLSPAGELLGEVDVDTIVDPRSCARLALPSGVERADVLTAATAGSLRVVHGRTGVDRQLIRPRWDVAVGVDGSAINVAVTARTLIRDLCLFADHVDPDAVVDDQLITLLPGETHRFEVRSAGRVDPADWVERLADDRLILRAVGDRRTG
jgi:beta-mannosidase